MRTNKAGLIFSSAGHPTDPKV